MTDFNPDHPTLDDRIASTLLRLGTAMRSQSWTQAEQSGLTPTQMELLTLLAGRGHALKLRDLAEQTALTPATVSDAVSALVSKGLVEKGRAADDARALAIRLTAAGESAADRAGGWTGFLIDAAATLDEQEKPVFYRALLKLIRTLQERGQIPVSRMCVTCQHFRPYQHEDDAHPHHCGLVDAPLADTQLRFDCPEHQAAEPDLARANWARFARVIPLARR